MADAIAAVRAALAAADRGGARPAAVIGTGGRARYLHHALEAALLEAGALPLGGR